MSALPHQALSPLDGRYRNVVSPLAEYLSEGALNRARVKIELEWLIFLAEHQLFELPPVPPDVAERLRTWANDFGDTEIKELARIEATTKHDVKAVEYLLRQTLDKHDLEKYAELVHFACTSEDINNLAHALNIKDALHQVWLPRFDAVLTALRTLAKDHHTQPMLSRTHGQSATPTTFGKEIAVFAHRLIRQRKNILAVPFLGKFSGATGTFSAHLLASPKTDWVSYSRKFVTSLGLAWNPLTTQIESHDSQAELFVSLAHANRILHNLATDIWSYISLGYLTQIPETGTTGSSTMPHKINPIRFENAEANLEISSALLDTLATTLVTSRMQRDLTDSTTQRNTGVALGHSLLALDNLVHGLNQIAVNPQALEEDLAKNWEVLTEAIQTVIRAEVLAGRSKITDPYALLKEFSRGKSLTQESLADFVQQLDIAESAKTRLLTLTPANYIGLAPQLVSYLAESSSSSSSG